MTTQAQPRTGYRQHPALLPSVLCMLIVASCCAPAAQAQFNPAPVPGTGIRTLQVLDQNAWAAIVASGSAPASVGMTTNRGVTWTSVAGLLNGADTPTGLAAAPAGTYRAVVGHAGTPSRFQVKSITRAGIVTNLGPAFSRPAMGAGDTAVDDDGTTWVPFLFAFSQPRSWGVVRVTASGAISEIVGAPGPAVTRVDAVRTPDGMRIWAHGAGSHRVEGTSLVPDGPEPVLLRDGRLVMTANAISVDGGSHWINRPGTRVVAGAPGQPAPTSLRIGRRVATRFDARVFRAAPPLIPGLASGPVVSTGAGYVAWGPTAIAVHDGGLPAWPAAIGAVEPDTAAMLARSNELRNDAGLPPLVGDALLSQAARSHANYDKQWGEGHSETSGRAGFTGQSPAQRCTFAGTSCGVEVMHFGLSAPDAVDGWVATPFHRPPILDPRSGIVGAAQSAGPGPTSVMNSGEQLNALVAPVGYPQGDYRGSVAFHGESPDPAGQCSARGQAVSYPLGAAITLFAPGPAQMVGLREVGGAALAGCALDDVFLPEDPLFAGRTYEATGTWDVGGAREQHTWTFTARPGATRAGVGTAPRLLPPPLSSSRRDGSRPLLSALSLSPSRFRAATRGKSVTARGFSRVSYTVSGPASVSFKVERARAGRRVGARCVTPKHTNRRAKRCTRYVTLPGSFTHTARSGANALRFSGRLRNRRLASGRYRLRVVATDPANSRSQPRRRRFEIVRR